MEWHTSCTLIDRQVKPQEGEKDDEKEIRIKIFLVPGMYGAYLPQEGQRQMELHGLEP